MTLEIIIIICVIVIFILFARRLPDFSKKPFSFNSKNASPKFHFPKFNFGNKKEHPLQKQADFWKEEKVDLTNKSNFEKGDIYFDGGDYKEAEKYYIKAAAETPDNPKIYNRLGIIYLELKNYRDAKDAFGELLKFDDKKPSRQINYGLACLNLRNYDEAIGAFEKAVKLEPKNKKYTDLLSDTKNKKKLFEKK